MSQSELVVYVTVFKEGIRACSSESQLFNLICVFDYVLFW